jgi:chromosome segregation ATPase
MVPAPTPPGPSLEPSPITKLTEWFEWFSRPAQLLDELRKDIKSLEEGRARLADALALARAENEKKANDAAERRQKLGELEEKLNSSTEAEAAARQRSESLQAELAKQSSVIARLRADLERQTAEALERQSELSQRIQKNAEGRLEEYRTRLASAFSRLFTGVPARGSQVSADDCQALLTRFYEIADFLDQEGIKVIPR